jgi:hypothetical protein
MLRARGEIGVAGETVGLRALNSGVDSFEILCSSGVAERTTRVAGGENVGAWYALEPWREQRQPACGYAAAEGSDDDVLLAYLGAEFAARAHETVIPLLARPDGESKLALASATRELRERLHSQLEGFGVPLGTDGPADVIVTPPGAESTSFNYLERRYMGLHIDQHDGLPVARRGQARRLCLVNVGWQHRYVYVYPQRVMDLCHAVGITPGPDDLVTRSREVTARYFAAHQDAGILRIRIEPGAGYVMNAQDLVHDGATPGGNAPAVAFHSMGTLRASPGNLRPEIPGD